MNEWNPDKSANLYGISYWGADYFSVDTDGQVCAIAKPNGTEHHVPLTDIMSGLEERGHAMPVLLRIENILDRRISQINQGFAKAISQVGYQGEYRGVFPIKVNQQCHVIEEITKFGRQYHHGLEAGSKAELIIAMSHLEDREACIVCNGYKDSEFIQLGLHAVQLGMKCFFVVETPSEIGIIIEQSRNMGIEPLIGVRVKLSSKVEGHWFEDSGDRSLFGLSAIQLVDVIDQLKTANMLHCLQLMHCHIGSQIPNIRNIRSGVQEACRYYIDMINEGAPLGYMDLGGGLAVDYTGASTNETHSKNYSLDEYCVDIVETLSEALSAHDISHPTIITESGRATVAYSSVLLFNVLDVSHFKAKNLPDSLPEGCSEFTENIWDSLQRLSPSNIQEICNDAVHYREELRRMFRQGLVGLREMSLNESIYLEILQRAKVLLPTLRRIPPELQNLDESLADIYYGNFSLFQSLPDAWAIDQIFPVMPVHRLNEEPKNQAVIADITCDSDGKIDLFTSGDGESRMIPLHDVNEGEEYYLGVFLVGAYQETLGDLHNLFGDTNVVSVRIDEQGKLEYVEEIEGDSIGDVLSYVEYNPKEMFELFRIQAEAAVKAGTISVGQRRAMLNTFRTSLAGYTYFEREE
ncbi:biosynthetic arginine decarboxylase [Alteromonas sp. 5E99-2]|uniref:biosynthetic arginine decarboxylase n=1 Tax=Alteromonas sp. 5E99-2 TaxID=2817683 RepID=UPI001A99CEB1|nr:biosynthetic arginine decarboxylase [Alteromonas sp. 5E99-2]MBO1254494.1 biosynthetic arginine decarboxylase [Alteromonas sp. 5E99-2]